MEKSKLDSFVRRAAAALVMAPLTVFVLYLGTPFVNLFFFMCATVLAWEWVSLVPNNKPVFYASTFVYTAAVFTIFGILFFPLSFGVLLLSMLLVWYKSRGEKHRGLLLLGVPYIAIGFGSVVSLYEMGGFVLLLWYILMIWSVDVGGYVVGTALKGPKLAPKISPNKTWAGLLGGMALAALVSVIYTEYLMFDYTPGAAVAAAFVALVAQAGDLVESKIKRLMGVKDSSNLIPGHGGMFDRVDGLIFAAPFTLAVMMFFFYVF